MACFDCEHISVSETHCPYAESVYHKEMRIEDPNEIPEWCPLLNDKGYQLFFNGKQIK